MRSLSHRDAEVRDRRRKLAARPRVERGKGVARPRRAASASPRPVRELARGGAPHGGGSRGGWELELEPRQPWMEIEERGRGEEDATLPVPWPPARSTPAELRSSEARRATARRRAPPCPDVLRTTAHRGTQTPITRLAGRTQTPRRRSTPPGPLAGRGAAAPRCSSATSSAPWPCGQSS